MTSVPFFVLLLTTIIVTDLMQITGASKSKKISELERQLAALQIAVSQLKEAGGIKGEPGLTGFDGEPGVMGPAGRDGVDGFDGPVGLKGDAGYPGFDGNAGMKGSKGEPGRDGLVGSKGDHGSTG